MGGGEGAAVAEYAGDSYEMPVGPGDIGISRPDAVNELELRCVPDGDAMTLVFSINGMEVARGRDQDPLEVDEWETGLFLDGSPLPAGHETRMRFDNYEVRPARP